MPPRRRKKGGEAQTQRDLWFLLSLSLSVFLFVCPFLTLPLPHYFPQPHRPSFFFFSSSSLSCSRPSVSRYSMSPPTGGVGAFLPLCLPFKPPLWFSANSCRPSVCLSVCLSLLSLRVFRESHALADFLRLCCPRTVSRESFEASSVRTTTHASPREQTPRGPIAPWRARVQHKHSFFFFFFPSSVSLHRSFVSPSSFCLSSRMPPPLLSSASFARSVLLPCHRPTHPTEKK